MTGLCPAKTSPLSEKRNFLGGIKGGKREGGEEGKREGEREGREEEKKRERIGPTYQSNNEHSYLSSYV